MNDPDREFVSAAQKGRKDAFGKLVDRYYEMVYALSYGVLHNREEARDVVQEVFLKAYGEIGHFEGKSKFKTWLYRIAMNAAIDHMRRQRPAAPISPTDAQDDEEDSRSMVLPSLAHGPREEAANAELRKIIDQAIETLSPDHRIVLVLREWDGMSYDEIAEVLGLQMGTVMSRLHYARKKLAEALGVKLGKEG